jgi:2-keto-3-deoxy-L-rhamnonate aldolase RhmA
MISSQRCSTIRVQCTLKTQTQYPNRKSFKVGIKEGKTQSFGLFLNSSSPQIAEQLAADARYDWLLVDSQHSPVGTNLMQSMLTSLAVHRCPSLVRVGGPDDRIGKLS